MCVVRLILKICKSYCMETESCSQYRFVPVFFQEFVPRPTVCWKRKSRLTSYVRMSLCIMYSHFEALSWNQMVSDCLCIRKQSISWLRPILIFNSDTRRSILLVPIPISQAFEIQWESERGVSMSTMEKVKSMYRLSNPGAGGVK